MKRTREDPECEQPAKFVKIHIDLPLDCLFTVFVFCGPRYLEHVISYVCKSWKGLSTEEQLWKELCLNHWPVLSVAAKCQDWMGSWQEFYLSHSVSVSPLMLMETSKRIIKSMEEFLSDVESEDVDLSSAKKQLKKINKYYNSQCQHDESVAGHKKRYLELIRAGGSDAQLEALFLETFMECICEDKSEYEGHITNEIMGVNGKKVSVNLDNSGIRVIVDGVPMKSFRPTFLEGHILPFIQNITNIQTTLGLTHTDLLALWYVLTQSSDAWSEIEEMVLNGTDILTRYLDLQEDPWKCDAFNIELVDVTNSEVYEAGKQHLLQNPDGLRFAPEAYKSDKSFLIELLKVDYTILEHVAVFDQEMLEAAWKVNQRTIQYFPKEMQTGLRKYKKFK